MYSRKKKTKKNPGKLTKKVMESHGEIMFFCQKVREKRGKKSGKIMESQGILTGKNSGHPDLLLLTLGKIFKFVKWTIFAFFRKKI